ncbi:hypothetical protein [Hymenobacter ruber]
MFDFFKTVFGRPELTLVGPLEQQLRTVSITGRVAYCICCLETAFAAENINLTDVQPLLSCLWDFTSNPDLSRWEEKAVDFYSESILVDQAETHLAPSQIQRLKEVYYALSPKLLACIDETIEVGRGNLYAGVVGYSECTLAPTMHIVRFMIEKGYHLPPIEKFLCSPFKKTTCTVGAKDLTAASSSKPLKF